jgi:hypothetical protein
MPAALPAFTTISRVARTEVWAGAIRVSSAMGLPSATMETQVVFSARMSRTKVVSGFAAEVRAAAFGVGGLAAAPGVDAAVVVAARGGAGMAAAGEGIDARVLTGDVVTAELVPAASVAAGGADGTFIETAALDGFDAADGGAATGAAD